MSQIRYRLPNRLFLPAVIAMAMLTDLSFIHGPDFSADDPSTISGAFYVYVLQNVYRLGLLIFRSFDAICIVCIAAHAAHLLETFYCGYLCLKHEVSIGTSLLYIYGTALGGITQLGGLLKEIKRLSKAAVAATSNRK
jgi:hypothetical protein